MVTKASLSPQVSVATALTFSLLALAKVLTNHWTGRMVLVLSSWGWTWKEVALPNQQMLGAGEINTSVNRHRHRYRFLHTGPLQVLLKNTDEQFPWPTAELCRILTWFHILKSWEFSMQATLRCRWERWKACFRRKGSSWLAKLLKHLSPKILCLILLIFAWWPAGV